MAKVLFAPDSFKGSLPALEVASNLAAGWRSRRPDDSLSLYPQADGGEGTIDALEAAVPGSTRRQAGEVTGPDGRPVPGAWLELPGGTAVVELAQMSGLPLMASLDPLGSHTTGFGQVIRAALDAGATSLILGLGGSASTDAGTGALAALGARFLDSSGVELTRGGGALSSLASIDASGLVPAPSGGVVLLTDVLSPLTGPAGAAAVFGPQKGADERAVAELDAALQRFADVAGRATDAPGAGAAGGTAFGFTTLWPARVEPGSDYLVRVTGLDEAVASADVLVTGEGRFDDQSMQGKVVGQLLSLARSHGVTAGVVAGQVTAQADEWTLALAEIAGSAQSALADPAKWLYLAGAQSADALCASRNW